MQVAQNSFNDENNDLSMLDRNELNKVLIMNVKKTSIKNRDESGL